MTVTTSQDYVRPTMTPTEGKSKVYQRFENLAKAAGGPKLGIYPNVIFPFEPSELAQTRLRLRVGTEGSGTLVRTTLGGQM
jgi:hypothetical protein